MKTEKIKTITRTWTKMLRSIDRPGPEVDFDEHDVDWVEYCGEHSAPESWRTYYLYMKRGLDTLTVPHSELARFPSLLKQGMDSYDLKIHAPDPLCGSPT